MGIGHASSCVITTTVACCSAGAMPLEATLIRSSTTAPAHDLDDGKVAKPTAIDERVKRRREDTLELVLAIRKLQVIRIAEGRPCGSRERQPFGIECVALKLDYLQDGCTRLANRRRGQQCAHPAAGQRLLPSTLLCWRHSSWLPQRVASQPVKQAGMSARSATPSLGRLRRPPRQH